MHPIIRSVILLTTISIYGCFADEPTKTTERGRDGTIMYLVKVDSSEPGAKIEVEGNYVGETPCEIKVHGDRDGTFHNFGNSAWVIRASPAGNGEVQSKVFRTGGFFQPEDRIPGSIYFDLGLRGSNRASTQPRSSAQDVGAKPGSARGSGTAWFLTKDGYLVTAYHVIARASEIKVRIKNNLEPAELVMKDVRADLAILKVKGEFDALPVGESRKMKLGQRVFTLGYPLPDWQGQQPKFTDGSVSGLTGYQDDISGFQISAPVQPGNSGGPLVNANGEVIGIIDAKLRGAENVNYAIKSNRLKALLEDLQEAKPNAIEEPTGHDQEEIAERLSKATVMIVVF